MYTLTGKIYLPAGSWLIDTNYITTTSARMHIYGDGIGKTILIAPRTAGSSSQGVIYAESTSSTTFVSGVFIHDLTIYGESDTLGLSEFKHLVSLNGVDLFIIQRVEFKGFRGDAVYIGSGISGSAERHNKHGKILDCVFDGINYSNRNGVSIIDGYDVEVAGNTFLNCTDPTMPGPIDIEPDQVTVNVVKDIKIHHNTIVSFGGGSGIAFTTTAGVMTNKPSNIEICNNDIRGATKSNAIMIMARTVETISSSLSPMGVKINRNYTEDTNSVSVYPTNIYGIRGLEKIGNTHIGGSICVLGLDTTASVTLMDAIIRGNNYTKNGNSVGAVQFASIDNVEFSGNTIQEPKNGTGTYGVTLIGSGVTTTSTRFRAFDNTFIKGASQTHSFYATSHTQDPTTARNDNNQSSGGSLTNVLQANKMDTAAAPTTGTWATGNIVFSTTGANAGWRCSAGGTPGTWASF